MKERYTFDTMVLDLKKELSDSLTKKLNFPEIEASNTNRFYFKKKRDKKIFILNIILIIIAVILTLSTLIYYINGRKVLLNYNVKNEVYYKENLFDKDFENKNETKGNYFVNLLKGFDITFESTADIDLTYVSDVEAKMVIADANDENTILFEKTTKLKEKVIDNISKDNKFKVNFYLDYSNYYDLANKYRKNIKMPTNTYLVVTCITDILGDNLNDSMENSIRLPLDKDTIYIDEDINDIVNKKIYEKTSNRNIVIVLIFISIILIVSNLISIIFITNRNKNKLSVLEKKYKKIMKNYDNLIIEVSNDDFDKKNLITINVKYFVDLIDAQQELHVPILCYTNIKTNRTWFYIATDNYLYKYELTKNDEQI